MSVECSRHVMNNKIQLDMNVILRISLANLWLVLLLRCSVCIVVRGSLLTLQRHLVMFRISNSFT